MTENSHYVNAQTGKSKEDQPGITSASGGQDIDINTLKVLAQEIEEERRLDLSGATLDTTSFLRGNLSLEKIFGPKQSDAASVRAAKEKEMQMLKIMLGRNAKFLSIPLIRVGGMLLPFLGASENSLIRSPYTSSLRLGTRVPGVYYHFWASPADAHDESTFGNSSQVVLTQHISNRK